MIWLLMPFQIFIKVRWVFSDLSKNSERKCKFYDDFCTTNVVCVLFNKLRIVKITV